jgi:APA family basic amino acid/polyamine antiporter
MSDAGFVRGLRLHDAAAIVAGSMIGSGIFIVSQDVAAKVGAPGFLLLVWAITGVMTVMCALSYAELAAMFPHAGGQYVYLREAFGPLPAFLYGWTLTLVIQTGTIAAVGVAFGKYTNVLVSAVTGASYGVRGEQLIGILSIVVLTWINCRGLQAGKWVQNVFTSIKALTLLLLVVIGVAFVRDDAAIFAPWFAARALQAGGGWADIGGVDLMTAIGTAMVGTLFASDAWNNATFIAAEVQNPRKNVGLSLMLGTSAVIVLYLLVNVAYLATLPIERIANAQSGRVAAEMMQAIWGNAGALVLAVAVLISTFGCNNGIILSGGRLVYAMAQDGLFFKAAGELDAKRHVPVKALLFQMVWSSALALSGTYGDLLDYVIVAALLFYVVTLVGIFVLRRTRPEVERPYRAWGYPWVPIIYIALALFILGTLVVFKPTFTLRGLAIVLAGVPVYFIWRWRARPPKTA